VTRDPLDRYYTPHGLASAAWREFCSALKLTRRPIALLEPCCGAGAFGLAALHYPCERWRPLNVVGCDLDAGAPAPFRVDLCAVSDWTPEIVATPPELAAPLILTNPHYGRAREVVEVHRELQRRTGAAALGLLLRLTALEQLEADPPSHVVVWRQRPRWEGPGGALHRQSDSVGPILAIWSADAPGSSINWSKDWR